MELNDRGSVPIRYITVSATGSCIGGLNNECETSPAATATVSREGAAVPHLAQRRDALLSQIVCMELTHVVFDVAPEVCVSQPPGTAPWC
ncbi:hypothetical protein J6590_011324 [Homalodisca vitripennis]|nr:hypothetical protein J6590_011324 [Homalodisca vitripennis]